MAWWGVDCMDVVNSKLNSVFYTSNIQGVSVSRLAKKNAKEADELIGDVANVVVDAARKKDCNGVICGHIHHAVIKDFPVHMKYMNCGDWVESCTALVEHYDGTFEILRR